MKRSIIHVDMDAFFASVEQLDNPELKGKPVIVGGISGRGVVSTASYEARKYGVHSAMPMYQARALCPEGIFLPVRHGRYREVSSSIFEILHRYTDVIEPLSIDEAYLDVTGKNAVEMAKSIKGEVFEKTSLTVSAGVSYNKFLAKLASDWNKPDGLMVITEDMVPEILKPLPVRKVYGIGEKSAEKLNSIGIYTVDDLLHLTREQLINLFGKFGSEIYDLIRGIDDRPVETSSETKSMGRETTLDRDTMDKAELKKYVTEFSRELADSLKRHGLYAKTVTVKYKTSDFKTYTRSRTVDDLISSEKDIAGLACKIIDAMELHEPIRLIGVSVSNLTEEGPRQLSIFDMKYDVRINRVIKEINEKFHREVIISGRKLEKQ
ncbi:MAG: DNA polymerase IV [Thermoanaerobacteraceae bacterium]|nr:DNA polymerase IV [Thermoanaerobacteraceae bacterium]